MLARGSRVSGPGRFRPGFGDWGAGNRRAAGVSQSALTPRRMPLSFRFLLDGSTRLAVGRGAQLARHKVIGRPRTADDDIAVLQLTGGAGVAVLIALDGFLVDEMGDIDKHSAGVVLAAADLLLQGMEELVDLDREGAGLGLA